MRLERNVEARDWNRLLEDILDYVGHSFREGKTGFRLFLTFLTFLLNIPFFSLCLLVKCYFILFCFSVRYKWV